MHDDNPYAAPQTDLSSPVTGIPLARAVLGQATWQGDQLVVTSPCELPANCVYCNEPVDLHKHKKQTISYVPRWAYLGLLGGLLPAIIIILIAQKNCLVTFGLCAEHRSEKNKGCLISLLSFIGAVALIFTGCLLIIDVKSNLGHLLLWPGLLLVLYSLYLAVKHNKVLWATRHDSGRFWIKGFGSKFIEENR
jgi:hypothetical protein